MLIAGRQLLAEDQEETNSGEGSVHFPPGLVTKALHLFLQGVKLSKNYFHIPGQPLQKSL